MTNYILQAFQSHTFLPLWSNLDQKTRVMIFFTKSARPIFPVGKFAFDKNQQKTFILSWLLKYVLIALKGTQSISNFTVDITQMTFKSKNVYICIYSGNVFPT